jgi:hypothetical protein
MAITTPALRAIEQGIILAPEAYGYADAVLQTEGLDPLQAFVDSEVQRHHFAVALNLQREAATLQTLASLAFTDRLSGSSFLPKATTDSGLQEIARDLDASHNKLHCDIPSICRYIVELRKLGPKRNEVAHE